MNRPAVRAVQAAADPEGVLEPGTALRAKFARRARAVRRAARGEQADGGGDGDVMCAGGGAACTSGYAGILLRDYADTVLTFACGPDRDEKIATLWSNVPR